jgi:hypothetical protein
MYDHLWHILTSFLQKMKITLTTPYKWDAERHKFVLITSRKYVKWNHVLTYVIYGNMVVVASNVIQVSQKEKGALFQIISLGTGAMTDFATVNRWMHHNGAAAIVRFLDCMVAFQRSSTVRGNRKIERIISSCRLKSTLIFLNTHAVPLY